MLGCYIVTLCYAKLRYVMLHYDVHIMLHYILLCYVVFLFFLPYIILCYTVLGYVALCCDLLRHIMLHYITLCCVIIFQNRKTPFTVLLRPVFGAGSSWKSPLPLE